MPFKTYVIILRNLILMNIFFTIKVIVFLHNFKQKAEKNRFENSDFFKSNFNKHFLHNKG